MDVEAPPKAETFAEFARSRGWTAEARKITHRNYAGKQRPLAGWTVIARRGAEIITATWIDEVAVGPIGWHSTPDAQTPIPNQATARRLVEAEQHTAL